jgi:hypothetical protein
MNLNFGVLRHFQQYFSYVKPSIEEILIGTTKSGISTNTTAQYPKYKLGQLFIKHAFLFFNKKDKQIFYSLSEQYKALKIIQEEEWNICVINE